jgi:hypothetical protein
MASCPSRDGRVWVDIPRTGDSAGPSGAFRRHVLVLVSAMAMVETPGRETAGILRGLRQEGIVEHARRVLGFGTGGRTFMRRRARSQLQAFFQRRTGCYARNGLGGLYVGDGGSEVVVEEFCLARSVQQSTL